MDNLDYEQVQHYTLTVRATDSVSGVSADVLVSIMVTDVNDCAPDFFQDSYNISISESASFGSFILKVTAFDNDTGKQLVYFEYYTIHNLINLIFILLILIYICRHKSCN